MQYSRASGLHSHLQVSLSQYCRSEHSRCKKGHAQLQSLSFQTLGEQHNGALSFVYLQSHLHLKSFHFWYWLQTDLFLMHFK